MAAREIDTRGLSLRAFAARGVLVNTGFDLAISALNLARGFIVAAILSTTAYGIWGVLVASVGVLARLKVIGIGDKYIQQQDPDQELAFQRAFTLELLASLSVILPLIAALPAIAVIYGHWSLIPPGLVLITVIAADGLQSPLWVYYRRMDFVRQRLLQSAEPLISFAVAVALALAGVGYWALAVGVAAGAWTGAAVAIKACPYRLRWRFDRRSLRVYASFSGPVFLATLCSVALANGTAIAVNATLGLAAVGAVALAGNITAFSTRVDDLVASTIYPVICAMQDRLELLRESFEKSNRLALMWAMPFGVGVALFASDLVRYGVGEKWSAAVPLLSVTGAVAAAAHIGFNWDDYFRARSDTRPIAVAGAAAMVAVLGVGIPLLRLDGLTGLAIGIGAGAGVHLALRAFYLARLFAGFSFISHAARATAPTLPALTAVLLVRELSAAAELGIYVVLVGLGTWLLERRLLREALGYLLRPRPTAQ
jgi:O-antigen/teichoic acid export membrane protein